MADAAYPAERPSKGPGSGRRSRRSANKRRAIEASSTEKDQPVRAPTGRPYGERQASERSQAAVPLPDGTSQRTDLATALAAAQSMAPPGDPLSAPSQRPGEPVTAGLPSGSGPGPSVLSSGVAGNSDLEVLRALYRQFPTEAVRRVLERLERTSGADRAMGPTY